MPSPHDSTSDFLDAVVSTVRQHSGLTGKQVISSICQFVDPSDPIHGPGDDGAIIPIGDQQIVACGEAVSPEFVRADPYAAGIAAILANINDVAAMGGIARGIVNTVVGPRSITDKIMRGMSDAAQMYEVPIVGGHLTNSDSAISLSAFAVGEAKGVLSMANVRPGQTLLFVCSLAGEMRSDFPFFTTIKQQRSTMARDVRLFSEVAASGAAVSAKDVSMAGVLGSLAMLLEFRRCGARIALRQLPMPSNTDPLRWLISFPTFGFWLTAEPDTVDECTAVFESKGLICASVGETTAGSELTLIDGDYHRVLLDLATESVTGLWA
jgi:selenophosphate synthetase-related protein